MALLFVASISQDVVVRRSNSGSAQTRLGVKAPSQRYWKRRTFMSSDSAPKDQYIFFATCPRGLGDVLSKEIRAPEVNGNVLATHSSGVEFTGATLATGYAACLWLRTAIRVLHLIATSSSVFSYGSRGGKYGSNEYGDLYDFVRTSVDWNSLLEGGRHTFSVQVREGTTARSYGPGPTRLHNELSRDHGSRASGLFGTQRAQVCVKDAICDSVRDAKNSAPERPESHASADVPLFVTLHEGCVSIYRDLAGASLHKRGYRSNIPMHRSSLNEALAAGMLYLSGFEPDGSFLSLEVVRSKFSEADLDDHGMDISSKASAEEKKLSNFSLLDPMCGSGTILIEAALCRLQIAPGLYRNDFPFQKWQDYDQRAYSLLVKQAMTIQKEDGEICMTLNGSDSSRAAVSLARRVLERLRMSHLVEIKERDVRDLQMLNSPTIVISNPPWGRRLQNEADAWQHLGQFLKMSAPGSRAVLLSGDRALTRGLGMRAFRKIPVRIGGVDCRVLMYDVLD